MTTINTSEKAYKRILMQKQLMEKDTGRIVSVAKALDILLETLDVLLRVKEDV